MREGLVSVYMPTKNRSALMERAVDSVLRQTYDNLELLIVDDGSTDSTPTALQALSARDSRIRTFRNDVSNGAPASRNLAILHASGKWITGIDDDDWFDPRRIESFMLHWGMLESAHVEFSSLFSQDFYVGSEATSISSKRGSVLWTDLFEYNSIGNQVFTLTERLRIIGMFDSEMPAWQDLDVFIRLLKQHGVARLLDIPLYYLSVDERPDRISNSGRARIVSAFDRLHSKHPNVDRALLQKLFLQAFGKLYGHRPSPRDVLKYASFGVTPKSLFRLLSFAVRGK